MLAVNNQPVASLKTLDNNVPIDYFIKDSAANKTILDDIKRAWQKNYEQCRIHNQTDNCNACANALQERFIDNGVLIDRINHNYIVNDGDNEEFALHVMDSFHLREEGNILQKAPLILGFDNVRILKNKTGQKLVIADWKIEIDEGGKRKLITPHITLILASSQDKQEEKIAVMISTLPQEQNELGKIEIKKKKLPIRFSDDFEDRYGNTIRTTGAMITISSTIWALGTLAFALMEL